MENRIQINTSLSLSVDMVGLLECEPERQGKEHTHHFWEIILITDDFKRFKASLICPNELHWFNNDLNSVAHMLYIGFRFNSDADAESVRSSVLQKLENEQNFEKYAEFFEGMKAYGAKNEEAFSIMSHIFAFLTELLSEYMIDGDSDEHHSIASEIKKYISLNLDKTLSVKEIASTLYLSPKYIGNVFKKKTGMGILQYQKAKKMEKALLLLKSGDYSVKEVSTILGFENSAYFSNTFKEYYGLSPIKFIGKQDGKNL